jgi:hypothetical protein
MLILWVAHMFLRGLLPGGVEGILMILVKISISRRIARSRRGRRLWDMLTAQAGEL